MNVFVFCFLKFCADMSQRDMSQRPEDRPDRSSSARREKQALRLPLAGRGRGGDMRLGRVDAARGSSSQTGPSQTVDPTQYQQHYREETYQPQYYQEGYQPQYKQPPQQQVEPGMEDEDGGFPGGPYELSLLPNFGKHVACKLWSDKVVSIIALFNLMICY